MLTFIVPIKSQKVSSNWCEFGELVERTLRSICNQTDQNFKVVVVCHEIPKINFAHKNIHFIQVDFDPPVREKNESNKSINKRREIDKGKKLKIASAYALEKFNTDYLMTVDSDDFISNRITAFVNQSKNDVPGWYIKHGFIHIDGKNFLIATRKFSYLCGSSVIVKPNYFKYFFEVDPILYFDHRLTVLNNEFNLSVIPFSAGIYSIANGENHLMSVSTIKKNNNHRGWLGIKGLKRIINRLTTYRLKFITKRIKKEFSFSI